ncbi:uncharacterized protein LOC112347290 isoform X2 [Selaginella moellendorffii]|uniref:uncharacterized protein LOC112347290 isoform X2 n=1 Tax=Selaginella moellendorffii TaxID=88036 RepID=UPI000D1C33B2|nr:uncharacterized protein LOC112347290 isoform X2 [Selaginella moellendorffii]|eukprot:XP_024533730.1 uncharacterized protein LOC112347290 isoform X2 [Selaginella moellendorffii]
MPLAMPPGRKKNWKNSTAAIVQTERAELLDPIHGVERRGRDPLEIQPSDLLTQDHVLLALARGELEIAGSLWHGHVHREIKERRVNGVALSATLDDQLFQPRESVAKIIRAGWRVPAIELLGSWRRSSWKNFHSRYSKAVKGGSHTSLVIAHPWRGFGSEEIALLLLVVEELREAIVGEQGGEGLDVEWLCLDVAELFLVAKVVELVKAALVERPRGLGRKN